MSTVKIFGQETEYAITPPDNVYSVIRAISLKGISSFYENGSKIYEDCGHPEYATPECSTPDEIVRAVRVGDKIISDAADADADSNGVVISNNNVDYDGKTWGAHESYSYNHVGMDVLYERLIGHLVSRIIYTGAGGLNPKSRHIEFCISPRVQMLTCDQSRDTTKNRPIFNTRDRSYGAGKRLHLICGDGTQSDLALYLKFGTTAALIAMIENDYLENVNVAMMPNYPLTAIHKLSLDPNLKATCKVGRRYVTALDMQETLLEQVENSIGLSGMPEWTDEVCHKWREVIDRLKNGGYESVADRLDWAAKYSLFNGIVEDSNVNASDILCNSDEYVDLRNKLCEVDLRWHQIKNGIFDQMRDNGVFHPCMGDGWRGVGDVAEPPTTTRAYGRGREIKKAVDEGNSYDEINWDSMYGSNGTIVRFYNPSNPGYSERHVPEPAPITQNESEDESEDGSEDDPATRNILPHSHIRVGDRVVFTESAIVMRDGQLINIDEGTATNVISSCGYNSDHQYCVELAIDGGNHKWPIEKLRKYECPELFRNNEGVLRNIHSIVSEQIQSEVEESMSEEEMHEQVSEFMRIIEQIRQRTGT